MNKLRKLGVVTAAAAAFVAEPSCGSEAPANALPGASGTIYVTERTTDPSISSVSALDAATGEPLWTSSTGRKPIGVTEPRDTGRVYTSDEESSQVSVFDARNGRLIDTISGLKKPHHLMASEDGRYVYVAEFGANTIAVVDTSTHAVKHHVASQVANAATHAVWIAKDGEHLYATNSTAGTIAKLDARSGERAWEIPVGKNPSEVLVTEDGKKAFVSLRDENRIAVVDLSVSEPRVLDDAAEASNQPDTLSLINDGRTLVVGLRGSPTGRARAALIDTEELKTDYVEMPDYTSTGHQWLSANGRYTFMAVESPGQVVVINNSERKVVSTYDYPTQGSSPHGVFVSPQTHPEPTARG